MIKDFNTIKGIEKPCISIIPEYIVTSCPQKEYVLKYSCYIRTVHYGLQLKIDGLDDDDIESMHYLAILDIKQQVEDLADKKEITK